MGIFDVLKPSEAEILANKKAGKIYVADFKSGEGKYISTVLEEGVDPYDISLKISPKIEVRIAYIAKGERIQGVQISKLSNGEVEKIHLSTLGFEGILAVLQIFSGLDLKSIANKSIILDSEIVKEPKKVKTYLDTIASDKMGMKLLGEVAESKGMLAEGDIGNLSKKKESLELFKQLLTNNETFSAKKTEWAKEKDEDVWQHFFEENKWIFGYGLDYVFNEPISERRLEQVLKGSTFLESGKRPDGILKTLGIIQFLNIVEIKTPQKPLMKTAAYRDQTWPVSSELSSAVSQCQQYERASVQTLNEFFELKDEEGNRTSEEVFNFNPKCFLVIGNMSNEFSNEEGKILNPDKLSCFEYYRKNLLIPEIITFDQLYYRAKGIIEQSS